MIVFRGGLKTRGIEMRQKDSFKRSIRSQIIVYRSSCSNLQSLASMVKKNCINNSDSFFVSSIFIIGLIPFPVQFLIVYELSHSFVKPCLDSTSFHLFFLLRVKSQTASLLLRSTQQSRMLLRISSRSNLQWIQCGYIYLGKPLHCCFLTTQGIGWAILMFYFMFQEFQGSQAIR